jgi:hypothetical protein
MDAGAGARSCGERAESAALLAAAQHKNPQVRHVFASLPPPLQTATMNIWVWYLADSLTRTDDDAASDLSGA